MPHSSPPGSLNSDALTISVPVFQPRTVSANSDHSQEPFPTINGETSSGFPRELYTQARSDAQKLDLRCQNRREEFSAFRSRIQEVTDEGRLDAAVGTQLKIDLAEFSGEVLEAIKYALRDAPESTRLARCISAASNAHEKLSSELGAYDPNLPLKLHRAAAKEVTKWGALVNDVAQWGHDFERAKTNSQLTIDTQTPIEYYYIIKESLGDPAPSEYHQDGTTPSLDEAAKSGCQVQRWKYGIKPREQNADGTWKEEQFWSQC